MLSLITYSPSSSLFSYTTSLLSVPLFAGNNYLKQEISKFLIWNLIRSSKSCSSINSPMICYDVWFERGQPLPPGRPSNRLTFTMTPTWLRLKKGEDKVNISRNVCWLKCGACKSNVLCENHHSLIHSFTHWFVFLTLQSDPRDLWPLTHLIRIMRKHDLTNILTIFDNLNNFWKFWQILTFLTIFTFLQFIQF